MTQEWKRGQPLQPEHYFGGADLPADANVHGMIVFVFACFGGGCPEKDSYFFDTNGSPLIPRAGAAHRRPAAGAARRGALAVIAHVDRAFSYAFEDVMGTPQEQLLRSPLELLMKGHRAGMAADPLNLQWSTLAAQLGLALGGNLPGRAAAAVGRSSPTSSSPATMRGTTSCSAIRRRGSSSTVSQARAEP